MSNKILKYHSQTVMDSRKKCSDVITITVPKGELEKFKAFAQARGLSLNEFIRQAIRDKMQVE